MQTTATDVLLRDLELTLRARKALLQDPTLAPLSIGVTVHDRVAVLWGKVPSVELARQAQTRLRQVLGLSGVQDDLCVCPTPGASPAKPLPPVSARAPLADPVVPQPPRIFGALVHRPGDELIAPGRDLLWRPGEGVPLGPPIVDPAPTSNPPPAVWRPRSTPLAEPVLSPTVTPPGILIMPFATGTAGPVLSTPVAIPELPSGSVREAIAALCQREARFARIAYQVRGGEVHIQSSPGHSEAVFAFAQAVSHLTGVQRVILEDAAPSLHR
jgi:hypothetical protein